MTSGGICSLPSDVLTRIFQAVPDEWARREHLPLTCRAFAAVCDDITWDMVHVDPWHYKEQTCASMAWERVRPWLMKRAGNISGIALRLSNMSKDDCQQCLPAEGVAGLLERLTNLKDLTLHLRKCAEKYDKDVPDGETAFVVGALQGAAAPDPQIHRSGVPIDGDHFRHSFARIANPQWVPPPPPPPSGHVTLGPRELSAVAACRQLRRLQLDVSLRSAALAIAAVQLIAQSCTDLEELDIKMGALDPAYGAAVLPFPDALLRLPHLCALSLQIHCVAGYMPEGITTLTNLTSLNLHAPFSRWDALPPGFGTLPLVSLTLWHASFTGATATQELEGLTSLEAVVLIGCGLHEFPSSITALTRLASCDLRGNAGMEDSVAAQPAMLLTQLTRLTMLQVINCGNKWREEPACIAAMPLLRGSTGLPLPADFATLETADAGEDIAVRVAAASMNNSAHDGAGANAAVDLASTSRASGDVDQTLAAAGLVASPENQ